ncbi:MAG: alpha/beta hydrolase [Streptosporangiaceae bacterium]
MRRKSGASGSSWPVQAYSYGGHPEQFGQLRTPPAGSAPVPVVVLVHGGYWRSRWRLDLMEPLAADLARRGIASSNIEYRRPDRHDWDATTSDVEAAVRYLNQLAESFPIDLTRLILVGHSAGGQLAVRVAADLLADTLLANTGTVRPAVVVSLAGVLDLAEAQRRGLSNGAVAAALGGTAAELPGVYAAASPLQRLPLGIPQVIVTAQDDSAVPNDLSDRYAAAARAAGDPIRAVHGDGDHFTLIDPGSRLWADTCQQMLAALGNS